MSSLLRRFVSASSSQPLEKGEEAALLISAPPPSSAAAVAVAEAVPVTPDASAGVMAPPKPLPLLYKPSAAGGEPVVAAGADDDGTEGCFVAGISKRRRPRENLSPCSRNINPDKR